MFEFPVVFVDIETTGGSYRNGRVLEIAALRYENGKVTREFSSLIQPNTSVPSSITQLTGITNEDVADAPQFDDIADELFELFEGAVFIAHNVRFDYSFLRAEFERVGIAFSPRLLCTVRLSRALYPYAQGHSLQKIIHRHNIAVSDRHRALADTQAIVKFSEIAYAEHGADAFNTAIQHQLKSQYTPPHIAQNILQGLPSTPGVYTFLDKDSTPIYIGKSINIRSRVLSHFRDTSSKELKISQHVHDIRCIETGSELAALILESKLIKSQKPLYNRRLRRVTKYALLLRDASQPYASVAIHSGELRDSSNLDVVYGVYDSRTKAKKRIEDLTRTFELCPKLMGLEKTNRACFSYSLGKCKGACIGEESVERYNRRFEVALEHSRLDSWPFTTPVAVPTNQQGEGVVVDNWIVKGFYTNADPDQIVSHESSFDVDEYKIVRRFLRENAAAIIQLAPRPTLLA